ncbi:MAG: sulfite reductase subunit alpha [Steroidobacteraceae bacterium]
MSTQPANLLLAAVAIALYLTMCAGVWRGTLAKRRTLAHLGAHAGGGAQLLVVHAGQTGTAEGIAVQTADSLQAAGVAVVLRPLGQVDRAMLQSAAQVLFVVSTYGEGDPPDGATRFVSHVMRESAVDLSQLQFGLLALGDRTYKNFCGFGRQFEEWLLQRGASALFPRIDVDSGDTHAIQAWRHELSHIAATTDLPEWQDLPFAGWTLRARRHLNPGSQGAPVFHFEFQGPVTADWQAGDLLQVQIPADPDRPRDYSIASVPGDGSLHLLVRVQQREDGSTGLASGWLTTLPVGATLQARLRAHSQFRIGGNAARDLILIGNGTGLAGLRAHLRQRGLAEGGGAPRRRNWLLFGERQSAFDALYGEELERWLQSGLLQRLDRVYSRDGGAHRYVQECLRAEGARLQNWIEAGAAIYVCGSLEGMAEGVAQVLREQLGDAQVAVLQAEGRYMRDVY